MRGAWRKGCGHDLEVAGRLANGWCAACAREGEAERRRLRDIYEGVGPAPGLRAWRESLGVSLGELSLAVGTVERPNRYGGSMRRVSACDLERLEAGGTTDGRTRLLIAQALWALEKRREEERERSSERARSLERLGVPLGVPA